MPEVNVTLTAGGQMKGTGFISTLNDSDIHDATTRHESIKLRQYRHYLSLTFYVIPYGTVFLLVLKMNEDYLN